METVVADNHEVLYGCKDCYAFVEVEDGIVVDKYIHISLME